MEYRNKGFHLEKCNIKDKEKTIAFNVFTGTTTSDSNWEWSTFDSTYSNNEESPNEIISFKESSMNQSPKGVEVCRLAFKSKEFISTSGLGINIDMEFSLKDESSFWIFIRNTEKYDLDTAVIRISKESNCQKCFISMGTFVKDKNGENIFKIFSRQQLVDFNSKC